MRVTIEKIEEGAKYQNDVYNWWVTVSNDCGKSLYLFDYDGLIALNDFTIGDIVEARLAMIGEVFSNVEEVEYGSLIDFEIISKKPTRFFGIFIFEVKTEIGNFDIMSDDQMEEIYQKKDKLGIYNYTRIDITQVDDIS